MESNQAPSDESDRSGPPADAERLVSKIATALGAANETLKDAIAGNLAATEALAELHSAARASEEFVRGVVGSSPDCIKVLDVRGNLLAMSENGLKLLEIPELAPYLNTCWTDWWKGDDNRVAADAVAAALAGGTGRFVAFAETAAGTPKWWDVAVSPIFGPDGKPERLLSVSRDITSQRVAEERLRASEEHLRLIFQSIADYAIFTTGSTGIVTSWNVGAERVFGYKASEIKGRSSDILWTPEDRAKGAPAEERATADFEGCADDTRWHQRKDGTRFFATGAMRPLHDGAGHPNGFTKICRDVTAQREAERQLAEAQAQVAAAIESERNQLIDVINRAPSFMAILAGPQHVFERVNQRYLELIGNRDVLGKSLREALPEIEGQGFLEMLDRVYTTGQAEAGTGVRVTLQRMPGEAPEERLVEFVYQALRKPDGTVSGVFVHGIDLTERERAEIAARESDSRFLLLADAMPQLAWYANADGYVIWYNRRWYEYTGTTPQDMEGWGWQSALDPEYLPRVLERWKASIASGETFDMEFPLRGSDGRFRMFLTRVEPMRDAEGHIVQWIGTNTDVETRRRQLEAERAARNDAERASRMKDDFLATLSHELRTPLNAILGWSQILRSSDASAEDLAQGLAIIERNARAQTQIIEDLLDMSRIISGKVRLDVRQLDLALVVQAGMDTVKTAADAKGIRLQAVLDPAAGPVSGDPNRLQQVFWNLLANAVKFTPKGGRVQVVLRRVDSHVEVSVIDTGEGIAPDFLPHVFDRFRQADGSTTRQHGGLGLGLSIVKQLVELHGGSVRAESDGAERGTTFTVNLPLVVVHPEPDPETKREHSARSMPADLRREACIQLQGVRVLVVDDEPDARGVLRRLLEDCGAVVRTASSAVEAIQMVQAEPPDVMVSDIGMPGEDGYSLMRRVRELGRESGGETPALALTAYARPEDRMRAVRAGFHMHISKPVEPVELITMVAGLVDRLNP